MYSLLLTATDKHVSSEVAPQNFSRGSCESSRLPLAFRVNNTSTRTQSKAPIHTIALGCAVRLPRSPPPCRSLSRARCLSSPALQQGTATSLWQQSWTRGRRRRRQTKHPSRPTYVERLSFPVALCRRLLPTLQPPVGEPANLRHPLAYYRRAGTVSGSECVHTRPPRARCPCLATRVGHRVLHLRLAWKCQRGHGIRHLTHRTQRSRSCRCECLQPLRTFCI
jgi:hypothetical protein